MNASQLRYALLSWYRKNGRSLPWRRTCDPYAILISEFMLQQTQVATVLSYYREWLRRFPDFRNLARASSNDVLHAWQGLGYYARARNLHATAKAIMNHHRGRFPKSLDQMRQLPGVGKYTAHAVATFAFDQSVPIVETNTTRVLARLFNLSDPIDKAGGREALWSNAARLVPKHGAARFNSALVDLGALICLPRKPKCKICPVQKFCRAPNPEILPARKARPPVESAVENHGLVLRRNKILLQRADKRWRGMWILPPTEARSASAPIIHTSIFPFTNHQITLRVFRQRSNIRVPARQRWFSVRAIESIPIPSPHRRAIRAALNLER